MFKNMIKKSIHKSQHCNRNWDLSKTIPQEDVDVIVESATQCPVKQNLNFYKTHVITNRDTIEKLHSHTGGANINGVPTTNPQTLANLVIAFTKDEPSMKREWTFDEKGNKVSHNDDLNAQCNEVDRTTSVGIALGYVNLTATMLGYETGCCACFDTDKVNKVLEDSVGTGEQFETMLLMGIGYPDTTRSRLEHHQDSDVKFTSLKNKREKVIHG